MLLLLDQHEPQWDSIVSEHVLANHQQVSYRETCTSYRTLLQGHSWMRLLRTFVVVSASVCGRVYLPHAQQAQQPFSRELHGWTVEELRAYVTWAKATGQNLTMSTAAEQVRSLELG